MGKKRTSNNKNASTNKSCNMSGAKCNNATNKSTNMNEANSSKNSLN